MTARPNSSLTWPAKFIAYPSRGMAKFVAFVRLGCAALPVGGSELLDQCDLCADRDGNENSESRYRKQTFSEPGACATYRHGDSGSANCEPVFNDCCFRESALRHHKRRTSCDFA